MRFELTPEQQMIVEQVREFLRRELASLVQTWDEAEQFAQKGLQGLGQLGMLGICIPESLGGPALSPLVAIRSIQEIARVDAGLGVLAAIQNGFVVSTLLEWADKELQQSWLPGLVAGKHWAAWGGPLPSTPTPEFSLRLQEKTGTLEGEQSFVTLGGVAPWILLWARCDGGCQALLLPSSREGIELQPLQQKLGLRSADVANIRCSGVPIHPSDRIGTPEQGRNLLYFAWSRGRTALAAVSLGVAQAALHESVEYAKQRKQFGKPIGAFQAIQWKIADLAMQTDAVGLLLDEAALAWKQGDEQTLEPTGQGARLYASRLAVLAAQEAIQIHGGYGFTREFPVERLYRDAKALQARWEPQEELAQGVATHWWEQLGPPKVWRG